MSTYYGKRGQAFENLLDYTNQIYKQKGIALINKRPTPMKIIGKTKGHQHICVFDKKSTVDYDGVYRGKAIVFEAKSVKEKRFPLNNITDDQVKYLNQAEKQGAISFLIIDLRVIREVLIVPNGMLQKYVKDSKSGGRKSIPLGDLEVYGYRVQSGSGVPLDYLSVVDRLIGVAA
ncbi:Holliday junction resolvase RecU [Virgibacillus sp. W0430]|uniref:Holliday junction resolvase RecU n=1 Tax=Virgibacillus sp. W0430 TaxID=3391580 RepID=UPI003F47A49D